MKNKTTTLLFMAAALVLSAWKIESESRIQKTQWLVGTWKSTTKNSTTYERWLPVSKNELSGISFMLTGKDTFVYETIQLVEQNNNMFYIPKVKSQNNNQPVTFALKSISDDQFVFENLKHDYPQKISYKKTDQDHIVAEISGVVKGKARSETLNMSRVK